MKFKTTTKGLKNGAHNLKKASYCELQHLLHYTEPIAYTCGVYGWNYDVYHIHGLTICTGYRGMPGARMENCEEYETLARQIYCDSNITYKERKTRINYLLEEFCKLNGGY